MTTKYAQEGDRPGALEAVRVGDAMHTGVVTCPADASLAAVARIMAAHRIHAVVVSTGTEGEWNIVSDLDLIAAAASGEARTAGEIASHPAFYLKPADDLARAVRLLSENAVHHLIVLPLDGGRLVGIISTLDVADVLAELPPIEPGRPRASSGSEAHHRVDAAGL
jgi:CBS domain-containing protein